tara:strand:+ start:1237 stop:1638 length:402 start_codon:yes stop_codon:yes gene_type:complete
MKTAERLVIAKELLATAFIVASEKSTAEGLTFKYKSYPEEVKDDKYILKAWHVDIIVGEAGHGEKTIQQFRLPRPNNIDAKNMEYHAIVEVLATLTQGALVTWYEIGKILATDKEMQKDILDETKKGNIPTDK